MPAACIGLLLIGGAQIALGLWISSLCENVLVSAIGTYGLLLTMQFIDTTSSAQGSIWVTLLSYLSFYMRLMNSTRGVVAIADLVYFASFITLGLFLAQRSIEAIRFKRT